MPKHALRGGTGWCSGERNRASYTRVEAGAGKEEAVDCVFRRRSFTGTWCRWPVGGGPSVFLRVAQTGSQTRPGGKEI
jgi:hypothetical protein